MHVTPRHSLLPALLLLAVAPGVQAQWSLPEPIAPAVIGRPLDQVRPTHPHGKKHEATATAPHAHGAAHSVAAALSQPSSGVHAAKAAVDDRADPNARLDDVGKGTHFARKPLGTGVYIGDSHRAAVLRYFAEHPAPAAPVAWKIGEPLPSGAPVSAVPPALLADLPRLPPGCRYVELGGDVVMIASASKMVVDGVSRATR